MRIESTKPFTLLISLFLLICYHYFAYVGHFGFDDMHYAELAHQLTKGHFDFNDHLSYRFPIVFLTALSYAVFGVNDLASSLPPLFSSALILTLVYRLLRHRDIFTISFALSMTLFSEWFLFYSDKLMPDIHLCLAIFAAVYFFAKYNYHNSDQAKKYGLLFALALFYGFIAKGTIVLIIPWLLYLLILDLILKRNYQFWKWALFSGIILLVIYFTLIGLLTSNPFQRFEALFDNSYLNRCSYDSQSIRILLKRISTDFLEMVYRGELLLAFPIVLSFLFRKKIGDLLKMKSEFSFFALSAIILLIASNFMSISPKSYNPMCLDLRHYLFVVPIAAVAAALAIQESRIQKNKLAVIIIMLLSIAAGLYFPDNSFWEIYLPLYALLLIKALTIKNSKVQPLLNVLMLAAFIVKFILMIDQTQGVQYNKQREIIYEQLIRTDEKKYIITNPVQARIGNYYSAFDRTINHFLTYKQFDADTLDQERSLYLLKNWHSRSLSFYSDKDLPLYAQKIDSSQLVFRSKSPDISIFKMDRILDIDKQGKIIDRQFCDFETAESSLNINKESRSSEESASGDYSNQVYEYSATYRFQLDSIDAQNYELLVASIKCKLFFEETTEVKMVISIQSGDENYFWEGILMDKYISSYSAWWPAELQIILPTSIKPQSELSIFLWNIDKKKVFMDDFEVELIGIEKKD